MGQMAGEAQYSDAYWWSEDGLRLHYRDYAGAKRRPPIICIPGLTRNARDFEHVAERLAGDWRVICIELRGRGESAYAKTAASYTPLIYAQDVEALLTELKIKRFVALGTSLGGIVTMLLALMGPKRIAGALLNDIGPVIEAEGLTRIRNSVGKSLSWPTWVHAARELAELQEHAYPDYTLIEWIAMAKRLNRITSAGRIVPDYDSKIAEPMRQPTEAADLWPAFAALGGVPVTVLRGGLSDILSAETAREMVKCLPNAKLVTLPRVGHAPLLDEPQAARAIDALLKAVAE
jgi:pimeloyl-ACP methyl ester carboxylesterase